jgi:electron transport complex protein RnfD
MTSWPEAGQWMKYTDVATGATPLAVMKEGLGNSTVSEIMPEIPTYLNLFLGKMMGSSGEVAAFALLIGMLYMIYRKIITWHIPVSILGTVFIFTGILWLINPDKFADPLFHILSGGLILGAIFMATDYVTSPMTIKGMWIFGVGIGVITVLIRLFGAYPEGVQFAILIMNGFVPLLNKYIKPKRFGKEVQHG